VPARVPPRRPRARIGIGVELTPQSQVLAIARSKPGWARSSTGLPRGPGQGARAHGGALVGASGGFPLAFSLALRGVWFVVSVLELWLLGLIATQFFGGQEERGADGLRPSLGLFFAASLPLALRRLLTGIVAAVRSPDAALNALTLSEYREAAAVRLDLLSLAGVRDAAPLVAAFLRPLTDPFVLWAIVILVLGGREVYRLP